MTFPRRLALAALLAAAVIGAVLAWRGSARGTADLSAPELEARLTVVLDTIYAAYAEEDEARIYDRLAEVVAGDLVADLYLQRRRAAVADHAEGGETEVQSVEPFQVEARPLADGPGYAIDAAWRVVGRVRHSTHVHERINLYAAELVLAPVDGDWKLAAFTLTDIDRAVDLGFEGGE